MCFTIDEYAKAYSISPEMVHSRIRRNRLNYIIEDETTYIVVPKHQVPHIADDAPAQVAEKKTTVGTVIGLYQKENRYLKLKIEELEAKIDRLIGDKEQLLKDERVRIEKIYADKDTQLKTILELINTKLLQESSVHYQTDAVVLEGTTNKTIEKKQTPPVELKQYLRSLDIKSNVRKNIKRRFAEAFGADSRIVLKDGLFYLDFDRYDYSDLLKIK